MSSENEPVRPLLDEEGNVVGIRLIPASTYVPLPEAHILWPPACHSCRFWNNTVGRRTRDGWEEERTETGVCLLSRSDDGQPKEESRTAVAIPEPVTVSRVRHKGKQRYFTPKAWLQTKPYHYCSQFKKREEAPRD